MKLILMSLALLLCLSSANAWAALDKADPNTVILIRKGSISYVIYKEKGGSKVLAEGGVPGSMKEVPAKIFEMSFLNSKILKVVADIDGQGPRVHLANDFGQPALDWIAEESYRNTCKAVTASLMRVQEKQIANEVKRARKAHYDRIIDRADGFRK